ncbi:MAG: hypothetical protein AABX11_04985 [Nanoarchaeota archaeon]
MSTKYHQIVLTHINSLEEARKRASNLLNRVISLPDLASLAECPRFEDSPLYQLAVKIGNESGIRALYSDLQALAQRNPALATHD